LADDPSEGIGQWSWPIHLEAWFVKWVVKKFVIDPHQMVKA